MGLMGTRVCSSSVPDGDVKQELVLSVVRIDRASFCLRSEGIIETCSRNTGTGSGTRL